MMNIKNIGFASLLAGSMLLGPTVLACPDHDSKTTKVEQKADPNAKVATANFRVENMHCSGCTDHVKEALAKVDGIIKVDVNLSGGRVTVAYDSNKVSTDKIAKTLKDAGFPASTEA